MNENRTGRNAVLHFLAFHAIVFVIAFALFVLSFSTPFFVTLPLFYRGLLFIVAILIVQIFTLVFVKEKFGNLFTYRDIVIALQLFAFVSTFVFMCLPVTLDRSISVFMLGYMAEHPQESFTDAEMEKAFIDGYVNKYHAIPRRFDEQVLSRDVVRAGDGYMISVRGLLLVRFFEIVADIFAVDKRFVDPR